MKKELRYFQKDAINAISEALKKGETPYINAVTGFGKSLVMAGITDRALKKGKRVLQIVPNHTLCVQNYEQAFSYVEDKHALGVCSSKLSKFQVNKQAVIATQTSFLRRRATSGAFDLLLCDECDMVSPEEGTTYQKIIKSLLRINPKMKIVGLTGSPWRKDQGSIHDKVKNGNVIFTSCCYESDIPRLIKEGYISSVKTINTHVHVDLDGVKIVRGDYDQTECGVKFDKIVVDAVKDFKQLFEENNIKTSLIFASTIANGKRIVEEYGNDNECKLAHGDLSVHERNELVRWLKTGNGNRYLVNVGLYTRGFDFPGLESIVLLRATTSLRLYVQIIGRLLRTHDEKDFGFLADYGTNIARFGPIDNLTPPKPTRSGDAPKKLCLECGFPNILSAKRCRECDAEFIIDPSEEGKYSMKTRAQALQEKLDNATEVLDVSSVQYELAYSSQDGTKMIKMLIYGADFELLHTHNILLNHKGMAKDIAKRLILMMFIDQKNFYKLGEVGVSVDNILTLLQEHPHYFKTVDKITLAPAVGSRFKDLKGVSFK